MFINAALFLQAAGSRKWKLDPTEDSQRRRLKLKINWNWDDHKVSAIMTETCKNSKFRSHTGSFAQLHR